MISKRPFFTFVLHFGCPETVKIKPKRCTVSKNRRWAPVRQRTLFFKKIRKKQPPRTPQNDKVTSKPHPGRPPSYIQPRPAARPTQLREPFARSPNTGGPPSDSPRLPRRGRRLPSRKAPRTLRQPSFRSSLIRRPAPSTTFKHAESVLSGIRRDAFSTSTSVLGARRLSKLD